MTRLFVALAIASFSFMASAADKPLPVTVTDPVLSVEVSNADPIPVTSNKTDLADFRDVSGSFDLGPGASAFESAVAYNPGTVIGVLVQIDATAAPSAASQCQFSTRLQSDGQTVVRTLVSARVNSGSRDSIYVPLPNLLVPTGYQLVLRRGNDTAGFCNITYSIYSIDS